MLRAIAALPFHQELSLLVPEKSVTQYIYTPLLQTPILLQPVKVEVEEY
jgi:hypothetical protein